MPAPSPEAYALGGLYALALSRAATRGPAGQHLGSGTGASLEFHERRAYVSGDDVRHLDWSAYARTDQLMVRVYREEVLPRVEILVDASRSMAVEPEKEQRTLDLAALLFEAARTAGCSVALYRVDERLEQLDPEVFRGRGCAFTGAEPITGALQAEAGRLRPGTTRLLISDFLFPHEPLAVVRPLLRGARTAGGLCLLRVLGPGDTADDLFDDEGGQVLGRAVRLIDSETGEELEVILDAEVLAGYRERLARVATGLEEECRRTGGRMVEVRTPGSLPELCRGTLLAAGVLLPA